MKKFRSLVFILVLCCVLCSCGKAEDYEAAVAMMEAGDYLGAIEVFSELGDYEQSQEKLSFCTIKAHTVAWELLNEHAYDEAYVVFSALGDYDDSEEIVKDWTNITAYMEAERFYEMGEYEEAFGLYTGLGEYKDSEEMAEECSEHLVYAEAISLMEAGEYVKALPLLESVGSEYRVEQCKEHIYDQAMAFYAKDQYEDAYSLFVVLDNYKDSEDKVERCVKGQAYARAMELYEAELYEEAQAEFQTLGEYEDSAEMVAKCQKTIEEESLYEKAVALVDAGKYSEAMEVFEDMYNPYRYKDASEYMELCQNELMLADPLFTELEKIMGIESLEEKIERGGIYNGGTGIGDARQLWCYIKNPQVLKSSYIFEMGDKTKLQLPMTYGELYEAGWRLKEESFGPKYGFEGKQLNELFPAGGYNYLYMINSRGKVIWVYVGNSSSEEVELRDVPIDFLRLGDNLTTYISNDGKERTEIEAESFVVNGITKGSSIADVLEKFGWPHHIEYTVYSEESKSIGFEYWNDLEGNISMIVWIDGQIGTVDSIIYYG